MQQLQAIPPQAIPLAAIPNEFLCPITGDLMENPVMSIYGYTFEKAAIERWIEENSKCPITRQLLKKENLFPNRTVAALIERHKQEHAQATALPSSQKTPPAEKAVANSNLGLFPAASIPPHMEVMKTLAEKMGVDFSSVYIGQTLEQCLVGYAGIYTNQHNALYRRAPDGSTRFELNLANDHELNTLKTTYQQKCSGAILKTEKISEGRYSIFINTSILNGMLATLLGQFHKNSHEALMKKASAELKVPYDQVYTGDALETALVKLAGCQTSQSRAFFRKNDDYSTRFQLCFSDQAEQNQFIQYYQSHFPGFILKQDPSNHLIHLNTKILMNDVLPKLTHQPGLANVF